MTHITITIIFDVMTLSLQSMEQLIRSVKMAFKTTVFCSQEKQTVCRIWGIEFDYNIYLFSSYVTSQITNVNWTGRFRAASGGSSEVHCLLRLSSSLKCIPAAFCFSILLKINWRYYRCNPKTLKRTNTVG